MKLIPVLLLAACMFAGATAFAKKSHVLVFYKTKGFYHTSIPDGLKAIQKLGAENKFEVDTTNNADLFTPDNLKRYKVIVFLSTTQDVLNDTQQEAFKQFINSGGGFVGIHAATDTEYNWPWYGAMVGGYFMSHPPGVHKATLQVKDNSHPATKHLPAEWVRTDEWYNFKNLNPATKTLITIDESSYQGGKNGDFHPMSWYHEYEGGRVFYTALGHTSESFYEEAFLKHILGGIKWAMGK
jgi:type 1 glutamine amidotransferase